MQEKDSDAVNNQRKRRKRIGKIKSGIIIIVAAWFLFSLALIVCLFVKLYSLENRQSQLETDFQEFMVQMNETEENPDTEGTDTSEEAQEPFTTKADYEPAVPVASGIDDAENEAQEGDIHKVYLTFDDGPSENTAKILDVLKEHDVKATFFVTGKEDEGYAELYKRIVNEGHTLGMHSYSNKYNTIYQSLDAFAEDLNKLRDYLYELTGTEALYYRFPGGSSNQISDVSMNSLIHYLNQQGMIYYDWNVSSGDAATSAYTADEIVANVTNGIEKYKTSIVLLHDADDKETTVEALEPLLLALEDMGAQILPINEDTSVIQYIKAAAIE